MIRIKGSIGQGRSIQAKAVTHIPTASLSDMADVDVSNREDGSIILWDALSSTWKVQGEVKNPLVSIVGGTF